MSILSIAIIIFIVVESFNVLTLYFKPGLKIGNGVGVFAAWERSKADPEMHQFIRYLVYWVAGAKMIFIFLLYVILLTTGEPTRMLTVAALIVSISSFFWRMFPIIRSMDKAGQLMASGYSKVLAGMIAALISMFVVALVWALIRT